MGQSAETRDGFVAFYRRYTRTWIHALATAALTAFGTLTFVNRAFAALAVAAYVVPPVVLYVRAPERAASDRAESERRSQSTESESAASSPETSESAESSPGDDAPPEWSVADAPTDETLVDAAVDGGHAYAVGTEGTVLASDGGGWETAVTDGPGADSNALAAVDASGGAVWFAGASGALGRLDAAAGRHVDHSAPDGDTTNIEGVAVASDGETETVLLFDGSGRVRRGRYDGEAPSWDDPVTPGSGSSVAAGTLRPGATGYLCDTSQSVFAVTGRGTTFDRIGVDDASGTFTGVATSETEGCVVSSDDGVVHRFDGATWTPERICESGLRAIAAGADRELAVGGAAVYERESSGSDWQRAETPTASALRGAACGPDRAVVVGDGGALLERGADGASAD